MGPVTTPLLTRAARRLRRVVSMNRSGAQQSWSQEGEDRILWRYLNYRTDGFYVDVGAHHPFRFSNTCLLNKAGWRGINIDAMPGSMDAFRRHRPRDVNLEIGVSETAGAAAFHVFYETALNTFDPATAAEHVQKYGPIERVIEVPLRPLGDILTEHRSAGDIDLLTVDAEGRDLSVLRSNDWQRFRPKIVLAESLGRSIDDLGEDPIAQYMREMDYAAFAKTVNTVMYVDHGAGART